MAVKIILSKFPGKIILFFPEKHKFIAKVRCCKCFVVIIIRFGIQPLRVQITIGLS